MGALLSRLLNPIARASPHSATHHGTGLRLTLCVLDKRTIVSCSEPSGAACVPNAFLNQNARRHLSDRVAESKSALQPLGRAPPTDSLLRMRPAGAGARAHNAIVNPIARAGTRGATHHGTGLRLTLCFRAKSGFTSCSEPSARSARSQLYSNGQNHFNHI